jgi:hypothetical protein
MAGETTKINDNLADIQVGTSWNAKEQKSEWRTLWAATDHSRRPTTSPPESGNEVVAAAASAAHKHPWQALSRGESLPGLSQGHSPCDRSHARQLLLDVLLLICQTVLP